MTSKQAAWQHRPDLVDIEFSKPLDRRYPEPKIHPSRPLTKHDWAIIILLAAGVVYLFV